MDDASPAVFAAADVHYLPSGGARAAAVLAADAVFSAVLAERTVLLPRVLPYRPGEFFLRELPPLQAVLAGVSRLGLLVIDGYADLDPAGRPGLGAHAHAAFGVPVIGVTKTRFRTATHAVEVLRGRSARPLFVTAAGMPAAQAKVVASTAMQPPMKRVLDNHALTRSFCTELISSFSPARSRRAERCPICRADQPMRGLASSPGYRLRDVRLPEDQEGGDAPGVRVML